MVIRSYSDLSRRFHRHPSTAGRWTRRDNWPAGVPRVPPWRGKALAVISVWVEQLQPDRAADSHLTKQDIAAQNAAARREFPELFGPKADKALAAYLTQCAADVERWFREQEQAATA